MRGFYRKTVFSSGAAPVFARASVGDLTGL
jgi:hypothetical protein